MHVYLYIHIRIHIRVHMYMHTRIYTYMNIHMHISKLCSDVANTQIISSMRTSAFSDHVHLLCVLCREMFPLFLSVGGVHNRWDLPRIAADLTHVPITHLIP